MTISKQNPAYEPHIFKRLLRLNQSQGAMLDIAEFMVNHDVSAFFRNDKLYYRAVAGPQ